MYDSLTSLIGTLLETRLYDVHRNRGYNDTNAAVDTKHTPATTGAHPTGSVV